MYYVLPLFSKCILAYVSMVYVQHESLGPNGGFSYYVFKKLHESRQFSQLLRLGEEFPEELSIFLKEHPDLLWLHDLFLHHFSSASETLHALALTQNMQSTSVAEEEEEQVYMKMKLKLTDRKNLLYLSKIAAFAGMVLYSFHMQISSFLFILFYTSLDVLLLTLIPRTSEILNSFMFTFQQNAVKFWLALYF